MKHGAHPWTNSSRRRNRENREKSSDLGGGEAVETFKDSKIQQSRFCFFEVILPPIIMEVENGVLEDVWLVSKWAIFQFHDYGRKGSQGAIAFLGLHFSVFFFFFKFLAYFC